jgi:hypothetical protein
MQSEAIAIRGNQRQSQSEAIRGNRNQRHSEALRGTQRQSAGRSPAARPAADCLLSSRVIKGHQGALACCSASSWRESRSTSATPWASRGDARDGAETGRGCFVGVSAPCWAYEGCRSLGGVGGGMGAVLGYLSPLRSSGEGAGAGMGAAWTVAWVRAAPRAARLPRRARAYSPRRRRRAPREIGARAPDEGGNQGRHQRS